MVQEAIKPHFQRLLSIAVNCCPENAIHVQIAASEIACALASVMSSSLIWCVDLELLLPARVIVLSPISPLPFDHHKFHTFKQNCFWYG